MRNVFLWLTIVLVLWYGCSSAPARDSVPVESTTLVKEKVKPIPTPIVKRHVSWDKALPGFVNIAALDSTIVLDIRYATSNNFVGARIYDCPACFLRKDVAQALRTVHNKLKLKGYRIKIFDCYRPRSAQQRLWDKVPNKNYVTPPHLGSMHSRGMAVDVGLADEAGREVDMGTGFDHFGKEAHHRYAQLPKVILERRKLLKRTMESAGFVAIKSEWWHYSWQGRWWPFGDTAWSCGQ